MVRTSAWTVPAIAVASGSPAFAGTACAGVALGFADPYASDPDNGGRSAVYQVSVVSGSVPAGSTLTIAWTPQPGWTAWASVEGTHSSNLSSTQDVYVFHPEARTYTLNAAASAGTSLSTTLTMINHFSAPTAYTATVTLSLGAGCTPQVWCVSFTPMFDGAPASYSSGAC